jgi:hypothetical protein
MEQKNRLVSRLRKDGWLVDFKNEWCRKNNFYLQLRPEMICVFYAEHSKDTMIPCGIVHYGRRQSQNIKRLISREAERRGVDDV